MVLFLLIVLTVVDSALTDTVLKFGPIVNFTSKTLVKSVTLTKNESRIKFYCALAVYESATDNYEEKYASKHITFVLNVTENATKDDEQNIEDGVNMETETPRLIIYPSKEIVDYQDGDVFNITCHGESLPMYKYTILTMKSIHGDENTTIEFDYIVYTTKTLVKNVTLTKNESRIRFYCALVEYESATDKFEEKYVSKYITFVLNETENAIKGDEKSTENGVNMETEPEITIAPAKDVIYYKDGDQQLISCTGKHIRQYVFSSLKQVNNSGIHSLQQYLMLKNASNRFVWTLTLHGRDNGSKVYCAVEENNDHTNQFEVKFTSANITFILNTSSEPVVTIAPAEDVIYYKDGDQQLITCTAKHTSPYAILSLMQIYDYGAHYLDSVVQTNANNRFAWMLTLHESNNGSKVYCDVQYYNRHTKEIEDFTSANITFISKTSSASSFRPGFSSSLIDVTASSTLPKEM